MEVGAGGWPIAPLHRRYDTRTCGPSPASYTHIATGILEQQLEYCNQRRRGVEREGGRVNLLETGRELWKGARAGVAGSGM
jgi:hypothetical protein